MIISANERKELQTHIRELLGKESILVEDIGFERGRVDGCASLIIFLEDGEYLELPFEYTKTVGELISYSDWDNPDEYEDDTIQLDKISTKIHYYYDLGSDIDNYSIKEGSEFYELLESIIFEWVENEAYFFST